MRAAVTTRFVDSRAADLGLAHGLARLPALAVHTVALPGAAVELRVLGASHQVVVDDGSGDPPWSEAVACLPGVPGALPARHRGLRGAVRTEFTARCAGCAPAALARRVAAVRTLCDADDAALVGAFPGSPLAVTALLVRARPRGGVVWRSWHAYPQSSELVQTRTVWEPA